MMTRQAIAKIISDRSTESMRVVRIFSRPPEKSNTVLVTTVAGWRWYCERPRYIWGRLDQSFLRVPYFREQKLLFPKQKEPLVIFDQRGLLWTREDLSSFGLIPYYLSHPTRYLQVMADHTSDTSFVVAGLQKISPHLKESDLFIEHLQTFVLLYQRFYRYQATLFMVFDEMAWKFREFLLEHLPKEQVNTYFPNFLSGEATREALRRGYVEKRGKVEHQLMRGVLYGMHLKPLAFYVPPKFFHEYYPADQEIVSALTAKKIKPQEMEQFFAYRLLVPLGYHMSEEAQYVETAGLSAHLGVLILEIAKKLKIPLEKIPSYSVTQLIQQLRRTL